MKKLMLLITASAGIAMFWGCTESRDRYLDLATGKPVDIEKDEKTGLMINKETGDPLYIYVDTKNNDTIYGKSGKVINGHVIINADQKYVYDEDEKLKVGDNGGVEYKDGDYKVEVEKDGDVTIKDGDKKIKIDGETGERKVKND